MYFQVKIWFQNRRTKWKKQENISNAEAAELMKAKNSQSQRELVKPPLIQPTKILTESGLIIGKLNSPSASPFLRPSSSASSSNSTRGDLYQDSFKDSSIKSEDPHFNSSSPEVQEPNSKMSEDEDRLIIADENSPEVKENNNEVIKSNC